MACTMLKVEPLDLVVCFSLILFKSDSVLFWFQSEEMEKGGKIYEKKKPRSLLLKHSSLLSFLTPSEASLRRVVTKCSHPCSGRVDPKQDKEINNVPVCCILGKKAHRQQDQARTGPFDTSDPQTHSSNGHGKVLKKSLILTHKLSVVFHPQTDLHALQQLSYLKEDSFSS